MNKILIVLTFLVGFSVSAYSQEQVPFQCDDRFLQIFGENGELMFYDVDSNTFELAPNNAGERINAAGYRVEDNFAYGIFTGTSELYRLGADGSVVDFGAVTDLPSVNFPAGDFADDGFLYIYRGLEPFFNMLFVIDVDAVEVVNVVNLTGPTFSAADIAFNPVDGLFYAVASGGVGSEIPALNLIAIDKVAGTVEIVGPVNVPEDEFGAASMYADGTGRVYSGYTRGSGNFFQLNTETGNATLLGDTFTGTDEGGVDGFFCRANPGPFPPVRNIPTLSEWGLITMAGVMGVVGFLVLRRRKVAA